MNTTNPDVLIVDDELLARDRLQRLVEALPGWDVAGVCGSGDQALKLVGELNPSVVLLDIRMPGMSGVEVARRMASYPSPPAIVFVTAYDEYAIEAFDAQAVGYLLKPVRREKLERALQQAGRLGASQLGEVIMAGLRECYAVLNDRRKEAAREAAPELDTELWFGSAETTTAAADGSDDHNGSAERSRA